MKPCRRKNPWIAVLQTVLLSSTCALSAHAADVSWINASGGNWNTPTNWDLGVVPGNLDHAIIDLAGTYTVTVDTNPVVASLTLGGASGTQTLTKSSGTVTLGASSSIGANGVLNFVSVTVSGAGPLTNDGNARLTACTINAPMENLGDVVILSTSAVNGSFTSGAGSTLQVQGSGSGAGVATFANGFTNNGTIELTSTSALQPAFLTVTNGTLVNATGSTIDVLAGLGGARQLSAQLDNQGTLNVGTALTMPRASSDHVNTGTIDVSGGNLTVSQSGTTPTFTNSGSLTVGSGRTCTVTGGGWIYNGGLGGSGTLSLSGLTGTLNANLSNATAAIVAATSTINGPATLTSAVGKSLTLTTCTINAPLENSGDVVILSTSAVNGSFTSGAGSTLQVQGSSSGAGVATFANGFTNNGTVELTSTSALQPAFLTVTNGTLVNATGSKIDVLAGLGGARQLSVQLDNQGTLNVGTALTMPRASSDHVNTGTIDVSGGNLTVSQSGTTPTFTNSGSLTVGSGRTCAITGGTSTNSVSGIVRGSGTLNILTAPFTNAGTISPGVSPGILSVSGNCPFAASGALEIEIGGPAPGADFDVLAVSATATLSGALNVSLVPGFCTVPGDTFRVLTAGTRTGTFNAINVSGSGNPLFNAQYDATGLTLVTTSNTLTVTASGGPGGSISPSGTIPVDCGNDQAFSIVADPCHHIVDVVVDGMSVGPVSSYTFSGVSEDHTISASFALNIYTITASAGPGGGVTPSGAVLVGCGADQGFTITPALGYAVADVLVDGQSVGPVTTYAFDDVAMDHTLAASFIDIAPPSVQVLVPNGGETWDALTSQVVRWTATDNASVDSVNVDYSLHGLAGPWLPIQHSVVGADSVSWAIPDVGTDSAMVRVIGFDPTGNQGEDVTDGLFEIRGPTDAPVLGVAPVLGLRLAPSVVRSGSVQMSIALPEAGAARVEVVSVAGRRIWEGQVVGTTFGEYALHWNGRDSGGKSVTSGLYFVRLTSPWGQKTARLIFLE